MWSHTYTSIAFNLGQNEIFFGVSPPQFHNLNGKPPKQDFKSDTNYTHDKMVCFALHKAAKIIQHAMNAYNIVDYMIEVIDFFAENLHPNSEVSWEHPILFQIKKMPLATIWDDICLARARGYSIILTCLGIWLSLLMGSFVPSSSSKKTQC